MLQFWENSPHSFLFAKVKLFSLVTFPCNHFDLASNIETDLGIKSYLLSVVFVFSSVV